METLFNIDLLDVSFEEDGAITMEDSLYHTIKMLLKKQAQETIEQKRIKRYVRFND